MRIGKHAGLFACRQGEGKKPRSARPFLTGAAVGGTVGCLLDPEHGNRARRRPRATARGTQAEMAGWENGR